MFTTENYRNTQKEGEASFPVAIKVFPDGRLLYLAL
jgi:hypothetical protein